MLGPGSLRLAIAVIIVSAAVGSTGCKKAGLIHFLSQDGDGWEKSSDTRTFAAKDLWQYIDGDAEQYISAGVVSTATSDYKYQGQLEAVWTFTLWVIPQGPQDFRERAVKGSEERAIGDAALAYEQSVIFRKGPYWCASWPMSRVPTVRRHCWRWRTVWKRDFRLCAEARPG